MRVKIDHDALLDRIQRKLRRRFPVGCRVSMTRAGASAWPKYAKTLGTVIRYANSEVSPFVLWDGRKTGTSYHPNWLRRAPQPVTRNE